MLCSTENTVFALKAVWHECSVKKPPNKTAIELEKVIAVHNPAVINYRRDFVSSNHANALSK